MLKNGWIIIGDMTNQNQNKQLDGLRRISGKDFHKSRSVVLDSIGEKYSQEAELETEIGAEPDLGAGIKIDSLRVGKKIEPNSNSFVHKEKAETVKKFINTRSKDPLAQSSLAKIKSPDVKKGIKKPAKAKTKSSNIYNKKRKTAPTKKLSFKEFNKRLADLKKSFRDEWAEYNLFTTNLLEGWPEKAKKVLNRSLLSFVVFLCSFIFLYVVTIALILNYGHEYRILSNLSDRMLVPAIVSQVGIIKYDDYRDFYNSINVNDEKELNREIARVFAFHSLAKKYRTSEVSELKKLLPFDEDVNIAPLNRIKKIKKEIDDDNNFVKTAQKYGDVKQLDTTIEGLDDYSFAQDIVDINPGENSDVIIKEEGYYVFHCFERTDERIVLGYVYLPTVAYEQYLQEKAENYRFWKLSSL